MDRLFAKDPWGTGRPCVRLRARTMTPKHECSPAWDPETFRGTGHAVVDLLADYLQTTLTGQGPVLPYAEPQTNLDTWARRFRPEGGDALLDILRDTLAGSNHLHHPRYIGHQVTSPMPEAALCDLVSSLLNNGSAAYEMGPVSSAMERVCARWMASRAGFGAESDGFFTSGGSAGNLTALLAMRQAMASFDVWACGTSAGPPLAILASDQAHYSARRAAQIMGMGSSGVIPVAVDDHYRMRPDCLKEAYRNAQASGVRVIGVVASAGSTATGAFDPLDEIGAVCGSLGLWLHVDGAHGASALLSSKYRSLLSGIAQADSFIWDAHKMMLMPALLTAVLFRNGKRSYGAFSQDASYLYPGAAVPDQWYNGGVRTLECTKSMMILKLYAMLSVHGSRMVSDYVTRMFDLGHSFGQRLQDDPDFELAVPPQANIVCFRFVRCPGDVCDNLQERIRNAIVRSGQYYIVQTRLAGRGIFLRTTLINPATTEQDLDELIRVIRREGERL